MAKKKKETVFKTSESLQQLTNIVNEAAVALGDKSRTILNSPINELFGGAVGAGLGGVGSYAALFGAGKAGLSAVGISSGLKAIGTIVGGGMTTGVFMLAAPIAIGSVGGVKIISHIKQKKLVEQKEALYRNALLKHEAIIKALEDESNASKDRIEYLQNLNTLLQRAIIDLEKDLEKKI